MVKVGGYVLGEFGNLIAGDERSRYSNIVHVKSTYYTIASLLVYYICGIVVSLDYGVFCMSGRFLLFKC